jgi:hypothetical protein
MVTEESLEKAEADAQKTWDAFYGKDQKPPVEEPPEPPVKPDDTPPEPPPEEPPKPPEEPPKPVEKQKDYEQMYKTLEGKYRAEVPRLNESLRRSNELVSSLNARVTELEEKIRDGVRQEPTVPDSDLDGLEADYPGVGKVIKTLKTGYEAKIDALEKQLNGRVTSEISTVKTDVTATKEQKFDADMKSAGVPDWQTIDLDPDFHVWLQETIPFTRFTRAEVVRDAGIRYDAAVASQLFLEYKKSLTKPEVPPPKADEPPAKDKLEQYVAPSTSTSGTAPVVGDRRSTYTRADYTKFMQESARGKFIPSKWGGKTEEQVELMFDTLASRGELL